MHVQTNASPSISSLISSWKMLVLLYNPIRIALCSCLPKVSTMSHSCFEPGSNVTWQCPMCKSRPVAHWNPSRFRSMSWKFGIGHGFLNVLLFSSRKSEMNLADPSFSEMIKVGAAHSECFTIFRTPILIRHSTSAFSVCVWYRGMS